MERAVVSRMLAYYASLQERAAQGLPTQLCRAYAHAHNMVPILPDQYVYAIDHARQELFMAKGFETVLGYPDDEMTLARNYSIIHPDDLEAVTTLVQRALSLLFNSPKPVEPMKGVWSLDHRARKANGEYIKVLRQVCVLGVDPVTGKVGSTLSICKDISNIKASNTVGWQYVGPDPDIVAAFSPRNELPNVLYRPSPRELDVLAKLAEGMNSRQIGHALNISSHTVNSHRKHLMAHTGATNVAALMALAAAQGWV